MHRNQTTTTSSKTMGSARVSLALRLAITLTCTSLALIILLFVCATTANAAELTDTNGVSVAPSSGFSRKLFALFDWSSYMKAFNKKYSSLTQQLVRQRIFLARTTQVALSAAKYKLFQLSYFTTINKYSDLTNDEMQQMLSGDSTGEDSSSDDDAADLAESRKRLLEAIEEREMSPAEVEDELKRERELAHRAGSAIARRRRRRRSLEAAAAVEGTRDLDASELIRFHDERCCDKGATNSDQEDAHTEVKWVVPSNNPEYEPIEVMSFGDNKGEPHAPHDVPENSVEEVQREIAQDSSDSAAAAGNQAAQSSGVVGLVRDALFGAANWFGGASAADGDAPAAGGEAKAAQPAKDTRSPIVWIRDWRKSGCMGPVRDQGYCNSCYAVASTGFAEWAWCMNQDTRVMTPLSVQYMVSCGPQYREEVNNSVFLRGCQRGITKQAMLFMGEYGMELEANMPYLEEDSECPIEKNTPRKKKGYLRPNIKPSVLLTPTSQDLDLALKVGPVIVSMREPKDFLAYGGGMIEHCHQRGGHAMLVVGNGIEDGEEFLLIKNSFSEAWGYSGYFKFKRSAAEECVKMYISPIMNFPSRKAQTRRIKAYLARAQSGSGELQTEATLSNAEEGETINKLFASE